jgi:lipopolysaccharide/colanic/teichoic acid biosynthesis glycosyltransferase
VRQYEDKVPCYHLRHLAKPGLTGWAQVNFPYGESVEDAASKLSFDLFYVTHASLVLDCSIILKTLYVVMCRVGGR